ncbi:MAG TPA: hypothetical protein VGL47_29695, partial [Amycolatopsis sp.]
HEQLLREWDGELPGEEILRLRGTLRQLAKQDRALIGAVVAAPPENQRPLARWVARRAFERAGLDSVGWIADGLRALEEDRPLPPPFDDWQTAWDRLLSDPAVPHTLVRTPDGRHDNALQQAMAFPAIFAASKADPAEALGQAVSAAAVTFGDDRAAFFAEARTELTSRTDPP